MKRSLATLLPIVAVAAYALAACAGNANSPMPPAGTQQPVSLSRVDTDTAPETSDVVSAASILDGLTHTTERRHLGVGVRRQRQSDRVVERIAYERARGRTVA